MIVFEAGDVVARRYRLVEQIGQGGMGAVWRAMQLALHREVALKLIIATSSDDERYRTMFEAEARLSAFLTHPNIVPVLDHGQEGDILWLVQQYVRGADLGRLLAASPQGFPVPQAIYVAQCVLYALQCAHENHVVHRDVKPANVLVSHDGNVMLTDFGIAKAVSSTPTLSTVIKGSPGYMAPEILRGLPAGPASDLFAVGALFWSMLTGKSLFADGTVDREQVYLNTLQSDAPPLATVGVAAPPALDELLQRLLAKDVTHRYASASHALEDLAVVAAPFAARVTPMAFRAFIKASFESLMPAPAASTPTGAGARRDFPVLTSGVSGQVGGRQAPRRRAWLAVGFLIAAAGGAAGFAAWRNDTNARVPPLARPNDRLAPSPSTEASSPDASPLAAAPVRLGRLTITTTPGDAKLFLNGAPVGHVVQAVTIGEKVVVRAERAGHDAVTQTVEVAADTHVSLTLPPSPAPSIDTKSATSPSRRPTTMKRQEADEDVLPIPRVKKDPDLRKAPTP